MLASLVGLLLKHSLDARLGSAACLWVSLKCSLQHYWVFHFNTYINLSAAIISTPHACTRFQGRCPFRSKCFSRTDLRRKGLMIRILLELDWISVYRMTDGRSQSCLLL